MPTPELVALGTRAVEQELDRDFEAWQERWVTPAGLCHDAPEPPTRYKTSPERIFLAALKAHEEWLESKGLVVAPKEPTDAMADKGEFANSEWLNDNAPIGQRRYRDPAIAVYKDMISAARQEE